jgi:hypothetical protein
MDYAPFVLGPAHCSNVMAWPYSGLIVQFAAEAAKEET